MSGVALAASCLEQWSRTHFEPGAIRASVALMPWRLSAAERFAVELALDGRAGDAAARTAARARQVIAGPVEAHPWDPGVRLVAADVEMLRRNPAGIDPWLREHFARVPNDVIVVPDDPGLDVAPVRSA